ncbi:MAG: HEAT repeat domain-containing protein [Verrucomicrobia bacterium]|nr:HEAT repeat domain-containing protein [Verrucomicrobiota bacterium]
MRFQNLQSKYSIWPLAVIGVALALIVLTRWFTALRQQEPHFQGRPLGIWLEELVADSSTDNEQAAEAIRRLGQAAVPFIVREMQCKDSALKATLMGLLRKQTLVKFKLTRAQERRRRARLAFMHVAADAQSAVPKLVDALSERDPEIRWSAANFVGWIGVKANADAAVPALIEALRDGHARVRQYAANALRNIGPRGAQRAAPALIQCLNDKTMEVRATAAVALGSLGHGTPEAIPALIAALRDKEEGVRSGAAHGLGGLGAEAMPAVPELMRLVREDNEYIVCMSAMALTNIAPEASVLELSALLTNQSAMVRRNAALALYYFGAKAKPAVPALLSVMKQGDESTAKVVQNTLANIKAP